MVAGPSSPPNLPLEVMGTPLIRLDPTPFLEAPVHLPHSCSVRSRLCYKQFLVTVWVNVQDKVTGMGVLIYQDV